MLLLLRLLADFLFCFIVKQCEDVECQCLWCDDKTWVMISAVVKGIASVTVSSVMDSRNHCPYCTE